MIKLVNFIRSEVQWGNMTPDLSSKAAFEDDRYLQPVLEDDAVLYSIDDVVGDIDNMKSPAINGSGNGLTSEDDGSSATNRIAELQKELERLQTQFSDYRETVNETLDNRWNSSDDASKLANGTGKSNDETQQPRDDDTHYFSSYSTNGWLSFRRY